MSQYRKKPIVIEAWQYEGLDRLQSLPSWAAAKAQGRTGSENLFILTLEGVMEATPGDWLIRGVKGEVYPCKPDIFMATYDLVE